MILVKGVREQRQQRNISGFHSNKIIIRSTLHEISGLLFVWKTWLKAKQAWNDSYVLVGKTTYLTETIHYTPNM